MTELQKKLGEGETADAQTQPIDEKPGLQAGPIPQDFGNYWEIWRTMQTGRQESKLRLKNSTTSPSVKP